jgi:FAD:protein FMN transferase
MLSFFKPRRALKAKPPRPAPPAAKSLHKITGRTMGTEFHVVLAASQIDLAPLATALFQAVDAVDRAMSTWKPDSDLSQFNRAPLNTWVAVPEALAHVVTEGLKVSRATQGAFDMTLGQAVNAWGFGPEAVTALPEAAQPLGQFRALQARMTPPALLKTAAFQLDLSGIAKGFGVDELARTLEAHGITDYLVSIDGEVRGRGRKPGLDGVWNVALEAPMRGQREAWDVVEVKDCALATSGDYRHFVEKDGSLRSHTIDGRTGWPVDNKVASVTVRHASCMIADAWASALMVLGPELGPAVADAQNVAALFLIREAEGVRERRSAAFTD